MLFLIVFQIKPRRQLTEKNTINFNSIRCLKIDQEYFIFVNKNFTLYLDGIWKEYSSKIIYNYKSDSVFATEKDIIRK
jgi:hypothetical protein